MSKNHTEEPSFLIVNCRHLKKYSGQYVGKRRQEEVGGGAIRLKSGQ